MGNTKTIHIVIENTKYGAYASTFSSKRNADAHVKALLKEYSNEYEKQIADVHELLEVTFHEVWIDQFESLLDDKRMKPITTVHVK